MPFPNLTNLPLFSGCNCYNQWEKLRLLFYPLKRVCWYHSRRISTLWQVFNRGKHAPDINLYLNPCFNKMLWINIISRIKSPAYKYQLIVNKIKYVFPIQIQYVVHTCLLLKYHQRITNNSCWVFSFFLVDWCLSTIYQQIINRKKADNNSYFSKSYPLTNILSTNLLLIIK